MTEEKELYISIEEREPIIIQAVSKCLHALEKAMYGLFPYYADADAINAWYELVRFQAKHELATSSTNYENAKLVGDYKVSKRLDTLENTFISASYSPEEVKRWRHGMEWRAGRREKELLDV